MKKYLEKFGRLLFYGSLTREAYDDIRDVVAEDNLKRLRFYTLFATAFFALIAWLYAMFYQEAYADKMMIEVGYVATGCVMGLLTLISRDDNIVSMSKHYLPGLRLIFYAALYGLTLYLAWMHPHDVAVSFVVAMVALPMMFTELPVFLIVLTVAVDVFQIIMAFRIKDIWGGYFDLWNGVIFGTISVVLSCGISQMRFRLFEQEQRVRILSETDVLTGTMNRNKFESCQQEHAQNNAAYIAYVYGDVNGLHELNNSKGHLAGDRMLQSVAAQMTAAFGRENVYRMGGDEFLAFVPGKREEQVAAAVRQIEDNLAEQGYHVSYGIAQTVRDGEKPFDVKALAGLAEQRMYAVKRAYYADKAHDRRRH